MAQKNFVVTSSPGLESMLADELHELGLEKVVEEFSGAVNLKATWEQAAKIAFESRLASKLLLEIARIDFKNPEHLEKELRKIPWNNILSNKNTFKVNANGIFEGKGIKRSFAPLKCKDVICDHFREQGLDRPNVDTRNPEVEIELYFDPDGLRVMVKLHDDPLHHRGYREESGMAPLRENKAVALLRFAGFDPMKDQLVDPFCGAGTVAIEAARMALGKTNELSFSEELEGLLLWKTWAGALENHDESPKVNIPDDFKIMTAEISESQIDAFKANAESAGVEEYISIVKRSALSWEAGSLKNKLIVCNPPHGDRVLSKSKAESLLREFAKKLKFENAPCKLALALSDDDLYKCVGFKPTRKLKVAGGTQPLSFWFYDIY